MKKRKGQSNRMAPLVCQGMISLHHFRYSRKVKKEKKGKIAQEENTHDKNLLQSKNKIVLKPI
jgi:hypothetical protein